MVASLAWLTLGMLASSAGLGSPPEPTSAVAAAPAPKAPAAPASRRPTRGAHPLKAELVAEQTAAVPGQVVRVGLVMTMQPGWHTYWPGDNDTGSSTVLRFSLPEGFEAGPIQWPAPERYIGAGDLLDYVYSGRVTLVVPIRVPASAQAGSSARIALDAEWLVCKEACIPGTAALTLDLPVANQAQPSPSAGLFAASDARTPKPAPDGLIRGWDATGVTFESPGASRLEFYVAESSAKPRGPIQSAVSDSSRLVLPMEDPNSNRPRLVGVLAVRRASEGAGGGASGGGRGVGEEFYAIDLPRPKSP